MMKKKQVLAVVAIVIFAVATVGLSPLSDYVKFSIKGTVDNYEFVDLGLSVKWSTKNVGASDATESGDYFIQGATRAYKGSDWRLPSVKEFEELIEKCTWTWTSEENTDGYKITGPNGNSIFLPAVGFYINGDFCDGGGWYWSCEQSSCLVFGHNEIGVKKDDPNVNFCIRPVIEY